MRFAVKPTSSILSTRKTVTAQGEETDVMTKGRHDPCVGIRAVPVGEAMMAIVLADHFLRQVGPCSGVRGQSPHPACLLPSLRSTLRGFSAHCQQGPAAPAPSPVAKRCSP